jgi:hypothetical protein
MVLMFVLKPSGNAVVVLGGISFRRGLSAPLAADHGYRPTLPRPVCLSVCQPGRRAGGSSVTRGRSTCEPTAAAASVVGS